MPRSAQASDATPPAIRAREDARQAALAAKFAELYPKPAALVFEVGCGHGHFLAAYAAVHPTITCLGVDLVKKRIERAQRKQQRLKLHDLAFFNADVVQALAALPSHIHLTGIFVLFPDPWPKTRHHQRRLLQTSLLGALADRAKSGTWLALRTDDADFFTWGCKQIQKHPAWCLAPEIPWPFEHSSYFQEIKGPHQSLMAIRR